MQLITLLLLSDIWTDPRWQAWGVIITMIGIPVGIIVTIWVYLKQRNRKELAYEVVSDAPVINSTLESTLRKKVEIRVNGIVVRSARLVVLKIWNAGNKGYPAR